MAAKPQISASTPYCTQSSPTPSLFSDFISKTPDLQVDLFPSGAKGPLPLPLPLLSRAHLAHLLTEY
ncbi:hypothetical protein Nepgr_004987 [Nepenthes gracilis]|uniref:Uncharacterized protein n=1 Tax=Nepenthes gracilis TaxID=150966 RepID=A0AAD3XFU2_NEPGR|nr:hypothetical protein Nepgr_004987 [Nepenthes gracilis]